MNLQAWSIEAAHLFSRARIEKFFAALIILCAGLYLAKRAREGFQKIPKLDTQQRLLFGNVLYYSMVTLSFAAALNQIGFDLRVILGAAGVLTVAIGFAAQTSASNLISGLFLMVDRPFVIGDVVSIGDIRGEILSIDLLSCKLRTFNNLLVRIPNETMVKSNIINYSFFPIRRIDFNFGVSYRANLDQVETILREVSTAHPLSLEEPAPVFLFNGFGESTMNIQYQVWTLPANLVQLQNELYRDFKLAFDQNHIELPHPIRQLVSSGPSFDRTNGGGDSTFRPIP